MTAAAARAVRPTTAPSPLPSPAALALARASWRELEIALVRGATPDPDALVGWEFRGINRLPLNRLPFAQLIGIRKFLKGFYCEAGCVMGYNAPVAQNALDGRWHVGRERFGFYEVCAVDATSRDNAYLHALLLDYGRSGNKRHDPTRGLRDYLVQVDARDPDLFLGKAYYALGPARIATSFFVLERHRVGPDRPVAHQARSIERIEQVEADRRGRRGSDRAHP
jgi:hypothetical protein